MPPICAAVITFFTFSTSIFFESYDIRETNVTCQQEEKGLEDLFGRKICGFYEDTYVVPSLQGRYFVSPAKKKIHYDFPCFVASFISLFILVGLGSQLLGG